MLKKTSFQRLTVLLMALTFVWLQSKEITKDDILFAARQWIAANAIFHAESPDAVPSEARRMEADGSSLPLWQVDLKPSGYLIMSSDNSLPPVVAFDTKGSFSMLPNHPLSEILHRQGEIYNRELKNSATRGSRNADENISRWKALLSRTRDVFLPASTIIRDPMLETTWDQTYPFNFFCPSGNIYSERALTGCVALGLSQLLKFHDWPVAGSKSKTFTDSEGAVKGKGMADLSFPYEWSQMDSDEDISENTITPFCLAVGRLAFEMSVLAEADYEIASTSASSSNANTLLSTYLGYSDDIVFGDMRSGYIGATTQQILYSRIREDMVAGRPALVSYSEQGGHMFIADGLGTMDDLDYYHFNYGWGGYLNGWYLLTAGEEDTVVSSATTNITPKPIPVIKPISREQSSSFTLNWFFPKRLTAEAFRLTATSASRAKTTISDSISGTARSFTVTDQAGTNTYMLEAKVNGSWQKASNGITVTVKTNPTAMLTIDVEDDVLTSLGGEQVTCDVTANSELKSLTVVSSRPDLLPASGIAVSGEGTSYSVVLSPENGKNGNIILYLTAEDMVGNTVKKTICLRVMAEESLAWLTTLADATAAATENGTLILMVGGQDADYYTNNFRNSVCEQEDIKANLLANFTLWYCNVAIQEYRTEFFKFAPRGVSVSLPFVAVIDPADQSKTLFSHMGEMSAEELRTALAAFETEKSLTWHTTLSAATTAATKNKTFILMVAGRDTCPNTNYFRNTVCETEDIKANLLANFTLWYCNVDIPEYEVEFWKYAPLGGAVSLPFIAIINPADVDAALRSHCDFMDIDDGRAFLDTFSLVFSLDDEETYILGSKQELEISILNPTAVIYYRFDGSVPTASDTLYSGAIELTETTTFTARAFKNGEPVGDAVTKTYTFKEQVAKPVLSKNTVDAFENSCIVTATCATPGAVIRYTTDGSDPTESSQIFPEDGLLITAETTIKACAFREDMVKSSVEVLEITPFEKPSDTDIIISKGNVSLFLPESWHLDTTNYNTYPASLQSDLMLPGEPISLLMKIAGKGLFSFFWTTNSESRDTCNAPSLFSLSIYVDGEKQKTLTGESLWEQVALTITEDGEHLICLEFCLSAQAFSASYYCDYVWIDNISWTPLSSKVTLESISIEGEKTLPIGGSATYTCTATFSDGTSAIVAPNWNLSSGEYALINKEYGKVSNINISDAEQKVTLNASYTYAGLIKMTEMSITLKDKGEALYSPIEAFEYEIDNQHVVIHGLKSELTFVSIPPVIDGKPVTTIGVNAFMDEGITSLILPESVTEIYGSAFYCCDELSSVTFPESLVNIGGSAFGNCIKLQSIVIPTGAKMIGDYAFMNCEGDATVTIPQNVIEIGCGVFSGWNHIHSINVDEGNEAYTSRDGVLYTKDMKKLVHYPDNMLRYDIPDGVEEICRDAMISSNNNSTMTISIPDSVTKIGDSAFKCFPFETLIVGSGVNEIEGDDAFYSSARKVYTDNQYVQDYLATYFPNIELMDLEGNPLRHVVDFDGITYYVNNVDNTVIVITSDFNIVNAIIREEVEGMPVTKIHDHAFANRRSLESVVIPESVTEIGLGAFDCCTALKQVNIPDGITELGLGVFSSCYSLMTITIPNGVKNVGSSFTYCTGLTSITIPDSVSSIQSSFVDCTGLKELTIGTGITKIGDNTFEGRESLVIVYTDNAYVKAWFEENMPNVKVKRITYLPDQKERVYTLHPGWNLLGIPFDLDDDSIAALKNYRMMGYDASASCYVYSGISIETGATFWLFAERAQSLTLKGTTVQDKSVTLQRGWNLVTPRTEDDDSPMEYKGLEQTWYWSTKGCVRLLSNENAVPGVGYWIYSEIPQVIWR